MGMYNGAATSEESSTVPYIKVSQIVLCDPARPLLGILLNINETIFLHRYSFMNVHSSFILNSPKLETTQMSVEVNRYTKCDVFTQWN